MRKLKDFIRLIRFFDWLPTFQATILFALLYAVISQANEKAIGFLALFIIYEIAVLIYGNIVNSISDRGHDIAAGKKSAIGDFPKWFVYGFIFILSLLIILLPIFVHEAGIFIGASVFFLATFYSSKPLRLKERGFLGIAAASLATSAIPFALFVISIGGNASLGKYLVALLFVRQLLMEISHQVFDFENDRKSGLRTWAQKLGIEKTKVFEKFILAAFLLLVPFSFFFGWFNGLLIAVAVLFFSAYNISHIASG